MVFQTTKALFHNLIRKVSKMTQKDANQWLLFIETFKKRGILKQKFLGQEIYLLLMLSIIALWLFERN